MKIASSELQLAASHSKLQHHETRESLRMWVGNDRPRFAGEPPAPARETPASTVSLSDAGKAAQAADTEALDESRAAVDNDPRLRLIRSLVALLTGREVRIFDAAELEAPPADGPAAPAPARPAEAARAPEPAGYGIEYDRHESYTEVEETRFAAQGTVRTADGREIAFSLSLEMSRSYHEESNVSLRLGDARRTKDPLVLNFDGGAAGLTSQRFAFDLDADGRDEQINFVAGGSGFLVFDRNGDGRANDGSELFGALSGDGFADLAALDDDGNGWIDENDAAFAQLAVWTRDGEGQDRLAGLLEANVGALSLARVATPFDLRTANNELLGEVRTSGVFLQEDGRAGTMQQIDLTV